MSEKKRLHSITMLDHKGRLLMYTPKGFFTINGCKHHEQHPMAMPADEAHKTLAHLEKQFENSGQLQTLKLINEYVITSEEE